MALSKGRTVTDEAPPMPAEKAATAPRIRFTHGSRRASMASEVTAVWCWARTSEPHEPATRSQSRRAARNLATVRNWSASAE